MSFRLFGTHVAGGPQDRPGHGEGTVNFHRLGQAEIGDVDLEWIPGKWLRLRSRSRTLDPAFADRLTHMLGLKPSWRYGDAEGYVVWEWRIGESEVRWREISGNPIYHHPERLSQD